MSAAVDAKGLKRICTECGTRFYDMNKRPITCPKCKIEFTGELKVKGRRSRAATPDEGPVSDKTAKDAANDDTGEEEEDDAGVDEVSLDDVQALEDSDEEDEDEAVDPDLEDLDDIENIDDLDDIDDDLDEDDDDLDVKNVGTED